MCSTCGSQGVHVACGKIKRRGDQEWLCADCKPVNDKLLGEYVILNILTQKYNGKQRFTVTAQIPNSEYNIKLGLSHHCSKS